MCIVNANYVDQEGMSVGQAQLLDDIISIVSPVASQYFLPCSIPGPVYSRAQVELDPESVPSAVERVTVTYELSDQHELFERMGIAQGKRRGRLKLNRRRSLSRRGRSVEARVRLSGLSNIRVHKRC